MFNSFWNNVHFPRGKPDGFVPELNRHFTINDDKYLIRIGVRMPDEFALHFGELELVVIHFGNDMRRPVFRESAQLFPQIDGSV